MAQELSTGIRTGDFGTAGPAEVGGGRAAATTTETGSERTGRPLGSSGNKQARGPGGAGSHNNRKFTM